MKIFVTDLQGAEQVLEAVEGWRVMEIIRENGLRIKAECGGACACATCHVYVDPLWLGRLEPMSAEEEAMLDGAFELRENSRLCCQMIMDKKLDGLRLVLSRDTE